MDQVKIGKFISQLRKEKNMTQLDLGEKLGVTDRAVSKWENGRGLPDISLIKPLCDILSISINELLCGERIPEENSFEIVEKTVIGVLSERELETRRRKRLTALSILLVIVTIIFVVLNFWPLTSEIFGDGYSYTAAYANHTAHKVTRLIDKGKYGEAAKHIWFSNPHKAQSEEEWCENMKSLHTSGITIENFVVDYMGMRDHYIQGKASITVYDYVSDKYYVYRCLVGSWDGPVCFGYPQNGQMEGREKEIADIIDSALCTWYAG